ncbi:ribonuclease E/G [Actinomadura yumaensis]|uniref:Rne/Rng family ribonuclease n=1 Tax=Actinomadura yumaensis TaxID=111807 RepID=UPI003616800C
MLDNEADSATAEGTEEQNASGVTRTPRRRASRPAGPPPEVEEAPAPASAQAPETAQAPDKDDKDEAAAPPKKATRTRTTRAKAKAKPEQAEGDATPAAADAKDAAAVAAVEAEAAEPAAEKPAPRTRTRKRTTAAATKAAAADTAADTSGAADTAHAAPAVPQVPVVPGNEPETGSAGVRSGHIDQEVSDTEPASGVAGVPGVTFQPPMVVFQPPEATPAERAKAASKTAPKDEPAPESAAADEDADDADDLEDAAHGDEDDESGDRPSRRRRRRGGRGRGRGRDAGDDEAQDDEEPETAREAEAEKPKAAKGGRAAKGAKDAKDGAKDSKETKGGKASKDGKDAAKEAKAEQQDAGGPDEAADDDEGGAGSRRRRRRRRRSGLDGDGGPDDPPNTVVHVRDARAVEDEVQSVRGSTRLEAKKQRRREGREQGRRRPPVITEAEFLARREAVKREMVVRQEGERTQIAVLEDDVLVEHYVNRATHQSYVGNVYLGKVQNVLPSMEAAFVDIGKGRNAVLYAGEVNWDVAGLEGQPRRIESALKSGQSVLVQVTKDPLGHKGARLTSQVSLPGRYLVYVPDGSMTGISRKLPDKERTRLKQILKRVMPENAGVIVRTAAEGATEEELARDVSRLAAQWDSIQKKVKTASAPSLLYGEPDLTIRVVRDIFNEDFTKLVVSGREAWDTVSEYVEYVAPHLAERVERWDGGQDALAAFRIDEQIAKALDRKVWLPSGGSLVIDRTEAMTVIDVNTGKFTGQGGNLEETVTRNNLEAAEEIVRQLRLRDIGGIIVIDFIDMVLENNRDLVLRRLVECLSRDRTKHQVAEVTSLGLVQMTRKRVGQGLLEAFSETCESCNGRGIHVHLSPVEPKQDKASAKDAGGRRRKRKGEVEKAVEDKLAQQEKVRETEPEPAAEAEPEPAPAPARTRARRGAAKRQAGPPPEPDPADASQTAEATAVTEESEAAEPVAVPDGTNGEDPAQAVADAVEAAAETAEAGGPGVLDAVEPVPADANGAATNGSEPAAAQEPGADGARDDAEEPANGRRRRTRRPRAAAAQTQQPDASGD